jgi:multidrug efflux pump subunit AcrB
MTLNLAGKLADNFLNNILTFPLAIFFVILGVVAVLLTPREENPQINVISASVIVPYSGATSSEVEEQIVKPLSEKLHEMSNIEHIYGTSQNGKGTVMVMFEIGSDREQSLLDLHDRVIQNSNIFPSGASKPIVKPLDVNEIPIVSVAIHSDTLDEKGLYQRALDLIHPLSIHDDISIVGIKGGHSREIRS